MVSPTLPLKSRHILIVGLDQTVRQSIALCLEIEGHTVTQAANGYEAVKGMRWITPDLIIAGIWSDSPNTLDFYREVRKNPAWVPIPFIFLNQGDSPEILRKLRELGSEDILDDLWDEITLTRVVHARLLRAAEIKMAHLDMAYLETVTVLAKAIESRDPYTHGHIERVVMYSRWLAEALGWPPDHMRTLEYGARLHDIGKIIVDDEILKKRGPLSTSEWDVMKQHPIAGSKMLEDISHLQDTIPYVLYHHEWWDGSGYPLGLKGRDIPIEGRLMAIVDVYDALSNPRTYHPALPHIEVLEYLTRNSMTQFDPELVDIFVRILQAKQVE
jgi:putative two-component system response regulator